MVTLLGNLGEGSYAGGSVWKMVLGLMSFHIGALLGNLGKGVHLLGTLRIS